MNKIGGSGTKVIVLIILLASALFIIVKYYPDVLSVIGLKFGGNNTNTQTGGKFDHIVVIAMENQNYADLFGTGTGSSNAPFLSAMLPQSSTIPNYHSYGASSSISGCSAACYVAVTSGDTYGVSDGYGTISATNIIARLTAAGYTWKAFCEGGCPRGNDHFPFSAYSDIQNSPSIVTTSTDFNDPTDEIWAELNSANPSSFIWLTPTDSHNMHDNSIQSGDSYLQTLLVGSGTVSNPAPGSILSTNLFKNPNSKTLLVVWWDEWDPSPNLYYGPMIKRGFVSSANNYDEYATLHTIENNWNLQTLTSKDSSAPIMSDIFA